MSRRSQDEVGHETYAHDVPMWARDNLVLKLLDDQGLSLEIMYDRKYLNGLSNRPLIVIRNKKQRK